MTNFLTDIELTSMRSSLQDLVLPDTGDILSVTQVSDGQGGFTDTWGTATAGVACRVDFLTGNETVFGAALKPFSGYNLTIPYSATITTNNRFKHSGNTYNVVEIDEDHSWQLFLRARLERV